MSVATVKHHMDNILEKRGLSRRAEAMRRGGMPRGCGAAPVGKQ